MRVLALDSSGLVASVAVVEGKEGNAGRMHHCGVYG